MRSHRCIVLSFLLATFAAPPVRGITLDFQLARNADLEQGTASGGNDLGTTSRTRGGIPVGDGSFMSYTTVSGPGNLNSADNGIGVIGGAGTARLGPGESVAFSFQRPVTIHGYTLNELGVADGSTWLSPSYGGVQTSTAAAVKGLNLPLQAGETFTVSTAVGDGIRIGTITPSVPPLPVTPDDRYQVLRDSSANLLAVPLRPAHRQKRRPVENDRHRRPRARPARRTRHPP